MNAQLRNRYVTDSIATASPARLLCMLYDRLQLDLTLAGTALDEGDQADAAGYLKHAQDIVFELRATLDVDAWDGGPGLASLYGWLLGEFSKAIINGDRTIVDACVRVVAPLREAWHTAAGGATTAAAPLAATA